MWASAAKTRSSWFFWGFCKLKAADFLLKERFAAEEKPLLEWQGSGIRIPPEEMEKVIFAIYG